MQAIIATNACLHASIIMKPEFQSQGSGSTSSRSCSFNVGRVEMGLTFTNSREWPRPGSHEVTMVSLSMWIIFGKALLPTPASSLVLLNATGLCFCAGVIFGHEFGTDLAFVESFLVLSECIFMMFFLRKAGSRARYKGLIWVGGLRNAAWLRVCFRGSSSACTCGCTSCGCVALM